MTPVPMRQDSFDIVIIGSGAGGGTMATRWRHRRAHPRVERGDFVPQERRELEPRGGLEAPALPHARAWLDAAAASSALHALLRRRQHEVLGQRALPPAARGLRRAEHADGVSPAWPIDYETLAPYYDRAERCTTCTGSTASIPPSRRAARSRTRRCRTRRHGADRRRPARAGAAPVAAAARAARPGRAGRLRPLQHLQLVPVQGAREERGRRLLRPARAARPNVTLWTNAFARACSPTRGARAVDASRSR
jgi:choline dehydrogenase-like flavoprotein